ncbi:MAG TPA: ABC transporter permease [Steroidobacteraceae bacterium]
MKFMPLVWAGLWRRPVRTILTAGSIVIAFVLLGLLQGVNTGFDRAIAAANRNFLVTGTRVRGGANMPISAMSKILGVPGVKAVAPRAYFMEDDRRSKENYLAAIATEPDLFFRMLSMAKVDTKALAAMRRTRSGMLATPELLQLFKWKVGDTVTVRSRQLHADGNPDWTFDILGTFTLPQEAYFGVINYDYLDSGRATERNTAEMFYVEIRDPTRAIATAAAIDRIFANSSHESRTRSQQERAEARARQMGDVKLFTNAILGAVLFTLAFLTGNTLRQSLQDRAREFAVLKVLGYSGTRVLSLAFAEALWLYLPPALAGLGVARLLAPRWQEDFGAIVVSPGVAVMGLSCAVILAFAGAALPAWTLSRQPMAGALRGQ